MHVLYIYAYLHIYMYVCVCVCVCIIVCFAHRIILIFPLTCEMASPPVANCDVLLISLWVESLYL